MKATIVIPTIGRKESLDNVLRDLNAQSYKDWECIISDEKGIVQVMNNALSRAKGEILIRIDDDVQLPKDWLKEIMRCFRDAGIGGVTGPTIVPEELRKNRDVFSWERLPPPLMQIYCRYVMENNIYDEASLCLSGAITLGSNYYPCKYYGDVHDCDILESTNYAIRTDLVKKVGGFDEAFDGVCEYFEQDVVYKVKKLGYKMLYNPKAYLYHLVNKGGNYEARRHWISRINNFRRFNNRHNTSKRLSDKMRYFTYLWFQIGYHLWRMVCVR